MAPPPVVAGDGPNSQRGIAGENEPVDTSVSPGGGSTPARPWTPPAGAWVPRPGSTYTASDGNVYPVAPTVNTTTLTGVGQASDYNSPAYNYTVPSSNLAGAVNAPEMNSGLFAIVAAGRGNGSTANGVFQGYVAESARLNAQGIRTTPQQLAYQEAVDNGWIKDGEVTLDPPGGGGGGGYGGGGGGGGSAGTPPVVSMMNRSDVNTLANSIAQEMLGRGVTDAELDRIMKRVRRVERNNPRTVGVGPNGETVVREGATQSTREQVIQRVLAQNPEYEPFQKATTLMDWFNNALQQRMAANG